MTSTLDRLVYMANQIVRNFAAIGHEAAAKATADHILSFWDPRMKAQIVERSRAPDNGLSDPAAAAIALIADHIPVAHQTRATEFNARQEAGHSDAG